jgi:hypothetical protein
MDINCTHFQSPQLKHAFQLCILVANDPMERAAAHGFQRVQFSARRSASDLASRLDSTRVRVKRGSSGRKN